MRLRVSRDVVSYAVAAVVVLLGGSRAVDVLSASVSVWVTPANILPSANASVVVHVRNLPADERIQVGISGPPPEIGYISSVSATADGAGGGDVPIRFTATEAGTYMANVSWGSGGPPDFKAASFLVLCYR